MKYFNKIKWTVGDAFRGGQVPPIDPRDKMLAEIDTAKRMNMEGISRVFSPLTKNEVKMLEFQKSKSTPLNTQLPSHE